MAESWTNLIMGLVKEELPQASYAEGVGQLARQVADAGVTSLALITTLGPYLTTENDAERTRAISALAEVVEAVPQSVSTPKEIHHLATFFAARLRDWPAIRGALRGCLALARRRQQGLPEVLADADAIDVAAAFAGQAFVSSLAQQDRQLSFELLIALLEWHGEALLAAGVDLLGAAMSAVDGEKDPRCLLAALAASRRLLLLYQEQPPGSLQAQRLEEGVEELFDVLSCYFPVSFTPPPGDGRAITRGQLAAELQATLAAAPAFAPHVVPLAIEKLGSTVKDAKLDSVALLAACAVSYGARPLADQAESIWVALRTELLAPAAGAVQVAELLSLEEVATAAAACLTALVQAFQADGGADFVGMVQRDACLEDLVACVAAPGQDSSTFKRAVQTSKTVTRVACAVCAAGGQAAQAVASQLLARLHPSMAGGQADQAAASLAWEVALALLQSTASAGNTGAAAASGFVPLAGEAATLAELLGDTSPSDGASLELGSAGERQQLWSPSRAAHDVQHVAWVKASVLAAAFAMPGLLAALDVGQLQCSVAALLRCLAAGSVEVRHRAQDALCALSQGSRADLLRSAALPALLAAATGTPSPPLGLAQPAALEALCRLAAAGGPRMCLDIVAALDQTIQLELPAAIGSAERSAALLVVVQAASAIAGGAPEQGDNDAPGTLLLAEHLLDAVLQLPDNQAMLADPSIIPACAGAVYSAARKAAPPTQQRLLLAAAGSIQQHLAGMPDRPRQPGADGSLGTQHSVWSLQLATCSAAVAAMRPAALSALDAGQGAVLVVSLVELARCAADVASSRLAALAAASAINKWQADPAVLNSALEAALRQLYSSTVDQLSPAAGGPSPPEAREHSAASWYCLSAVCRALAMRGDAEAEQLLAALAAASIREMPWAEAMTPDLEAAARVLEDAVSDQGMEGPMLGPAAHPVTRPLWQQRFYTTAMRQLAGMPHDRRALLAWALVVAHLLRGAPPRVVHADLGRAFPAAVQALTVMQRSSEPSASLTLALLEFLADTLGSEAGRRHALEALDGLLPSLVGLAAFKASMAVRKQALLCLTLAAELPYTALHPYRPQVSCAVAAALDDSKRSVRAQAARCHERWTEQ